MSLVGGDEVRKRPSHQYQSVLTPLAKTWYDTVKPNNDVVAHCSLSLQQDAVQERPTKQADGFCCTSIGHVRRANSEASTLIGGVLDKRSSPP
jgi:hypothetical protein